MNGAVDSIWRVGRPCAGLLLAGGLLLPACIGSSRLKRAEAAYAESKKLQVQGRYDDAIAEAEQALALAKATVGDAHPEVARHLNLVGDLHRLNEDYALAEWFLLSSLDIREQVLGKSHLQVAQSLNSLALVYSEQGLHELAGPLYEQALAIREEARDAASRSNEESKGLDRWAPGGSDGARGKAHRDVFTSLHNLARAYTEQGLYDRAELLYRRAFQSQEATLGRAQPSAFTPLDALARDDAVQGSCCWRDIQLRNALVLQEAAFVGAQPDIDTSLSSLVDLFIDQRLYAGSPDEEKLAGQESLSDKARLDPYRSFNKLARAHAKLQDLSKKYPASSDTATYSLPPGSAKTLAEILDVGGEPQRRSLPHEPAAAQARSQGAAMKAPVGSSDSVGTTPRRRSAGSLLGREHAARDIPADDLPGQGQERPPPSGGSQGQRSKRPGAPDQRR